MSYRVAIVGVGGIAGIHIQALNELKDRVKVVAAVDIDRARVEAYSAAHGISQFYTDLGAMLEAEQPDLVHIATPLVSRAAREEYQCFFLKSYTTLQVAPFSVNALGAEFVPLQEPLKPGALARLLPAGIELLNETLVTVTALPLCV